MTENHTAQTVRKHLTKHMVEVHNHTPEYMATLTPYGMYKIHYHRHLYVPENQNHTHDSSSVWMVTPKVMQQSLAPVIPLLEEDVAYEDQKPRSIPCTRDHRRECCVRHNYHTNPHKGCIMR